MSITKEQIAKVKTAKSVEELITLAKAEGIEMSEEEIKAKFAAMHNEGEIADEELSNVAGGCGSDPEPKYQVGQHLWVGYHSTQNYLEVVVDAPEFYTEEDGWRYLVTPVGYGFQQNYFLETHEFVHTTDPGPGWHD